MSRPIITTLRDIVPIRPLTRHEALSIAERQTLMFLKLASVTGPPFPASVISELPRIEIRHITPFPASGATQWIRGRWVIVLNGAEPANRQRFSLAHEFKHILDHPFVDQLYGAIDARDRHAWTEQVADYFAGCLLVPRPWLKRAFTTETQHLGQLAVRFGVSQAAMNTRLNQVGLTETTPRCARPQTSRRFSAPTDADHDSYYRHAAVPLGARPT
jgi:Zn-dependent peptidase ImmA (M78 family)